MHMHMHCTCTCKIDDSSTAVGGCGLGFYMYKFACTIIITYMNMYSGTSKLHVHNHIKASVHSMEAFFIRGDARGPKSHFYPTCMHKGKAIGCIIVVVVVHTKIAKSQQVVFDSGPVKKWCFLASKRLIRITNASIKPCFLIDHT